MNPQNPDALKTSNPLAALRDADGVYNITPTGELEITCVAGHSAVSIRQLWTVTRKSNLTPEHVTQLLAEGVITEQEARQYNTGTTGTGRARTVGA